MTLLFAVLLLVLLFSAVVRLVGVRPWRLGVRAAVAIAIVGGVPALCWAFALKSLGSGSFFGLVALIVSFASVFGAVMGWIWPSLSRKA